MQRLNPRSRYGNWLRPLRAGDVVEVRSFAEISATLDESGALEGLPFMPEMLPYCGQHFEVWKRADKTCDEGGGGSIRRLTDTVHLRDLRCSGRAHGGCDAGCLLFWKEQWLKRIISPDFKEEADWAQPPPEKLVPDLAQGTIDVITRATHSCGQTADGDRELFSCQATQISNFSQPLPWWEPWQYLRDLFARNVTVIEFVSGLFIGVFNKVQDLLGRSDLGFVSGENARTPQASLDLSPGDFVQIKPEKEIIATLDRRGRNRGLAFRPGMIPYCGKRHRVIRRVRKVIDPVSHKMISLRNCVILDGAVCTGRMRRFCPRMVYAYWRDIWLTKLAASEAAEAHISKVASPEPAAAAGDPVSSSE